jgi:surfactin synthase thioesterase subunit
MIWYYLFDALAMHEIDLYFIPFAGGDQHSYVHFKPYLPKTIRYIPLELPGRNSNAGEESTAALETTIDFLRTSVSTVPDRRYAFFGHSLGALLAYLLAVNLRKNNLPLPSHLFLSGCSAPSTKVKRRMTSGMDDDAFINEIRKMGGLPDAFFAEDALLAFYLPVLRADLALYDSYHYAPTPPLDVHFTLFTGIGERFSYPEITNWQLETLHPLKTFRFPGNHFFIKDHPKDMMEITAAALLAHHAASPGTRTATGG